VIDRVRCEGAPRDLGLDQGSACRAAIRAEAGGQRVSSGWARFGLVAVPSGAPLARDLARHFPHLAERTAGLAAGGGVPFEALLDLLARELGRPEDAPVLDAGPAPAAPAALRVSLRSPLDVIVRVTRPDGGYPNLTLTRPTLAAALAGVNEAGLAAAGVPLGPPELDEPCQAPGLLLVEGCLERLDAVEKALEWCERRPGGGRARLLFVDASGACGAVELEGEKRRRIEMPPTAPFAGTSAGIDARARCLELERPGAAALRVSLDGEG